MSRSQDIVNPGSRDEQPLDEPQRGFCSMRHVRFRTLLTASALMLGVSLSAASGALAQSTQEVEPNNACVEAQDLGAFVAPFDLQGSLDTPPGTPDVDYYRFTGTPGSLVQIRLDGPWNGGGTLDDPYLGVFDESCQLLAYNDDYNGTSSGLDLTIPASGTFVVAATSYGDWEFTGTGGSAGTYRLRLQVQSVAQAIGGRIVNAKTGAPVQYTAVGLLRCAADRTCYNNAGWASTDAQGAFRFQNGTWNVYGPLLAGTYRLSLYANGYTPRQTDPFEVAVGEDLSLGDVPIEPIPAVGSIRGRLVDEISGRPLSGAGAPWARVNLVHCVDWGCYIWSSARVNADGTFSFAGSTYRILPPGSYYIVGSADQYQDTQSRTFTVEDDQHHNFGDFRVKSNPARIDLVQACGAVPSDGGTCPFRMRVTNGMTIKMEGEFWAVVQGSDIGSPVARTEFSVGTPRALSLAPGAAVDLPLSFEVPGEVSDGATICVRGLASKRPHKFNTLGAHDLFCLQKGSAGFTPVPEAQKHDAVRRAVRK